jgi:NAD-dependent SIR2 family protein deacetylase
MDGMVAWHTPGPWEIGSVRDYGKSCSIETEDGQPIADIVFPRTSRAAWRNADMQLICAAPLLLDAAQDSARFLARLVEDTTEDDSLNLYCQLRETIHAAGGFAADTWEWHGALQCRECSHCWETTVELLIYDPGPPEMRECPVCHKMAGMVDRGGLPSSLCIRPYAVQSRTTRREADLQLICGAAELLDAIQDALLWMVENRIEEFLSNHNMLHAKLRSVIHTAGGFAAKHWRWDGLCTCLNCGHKWQATARIPIETTQPRKPKSCPKCHRKSGYALP